MSTEKLTADQILNFLNKDKADLLKDVSFDAAISAMEAYAIQETKQLREERDKAVVLLNRVCTTLEDYSELLDSDPTCADINIFLNQLNQKNEG